MIFFYYPESDSILSAEELKEEREWKNLSSKENKSSDEKFEEKPIKQ